MTELEKRFSVDCYRWAKVEFQREVENEFPILSDLRCSFSLAVHEFMLSLEIDERLHLASALLKFRHSGAAQMCGEAMTHRERNVLESYRKRKLVKASKGRLQSGGASHKELHILEAIKKGQLIRQTATKSFRTAVLSTLKEKLGAPSTLAPSTASDKTVARAEYKAEFGDWTVTTMVGFHGKFPLIYEQHITTCKDPKFYQWGSFLQWLGILGQTHWDLLTTDVAEEAIEILVSLCQRFLTATPLLLPENVD